MTSTLECDCGEAKANVAGFAFCRHCDTGHEGICPQCRRYEAGVSRRLNS